MISLAPGHAAETSEDGQDFFRLQDFLRFEDCDSILGKSTAHLVCQARDISITSAHAFAVTRRLQIQQTNGSRDPQNAFMGFCEADAPSQLRDMLRISKQHRIRKGFSSRVAETANTAQKKGGVGSMKEGSAKFQARNCTFRAKRTAIAAEGGGTTGH